MFKRKLQSIEVKNAKKNAKKSSKYANGWMRTDRTINRSISDMKNNICKYMQIFLIRIFLKIYGNLEKCDA